MAKGRVNRMDFRELHYLLTIAEEGSISKAAERLYMAQASLSQSLRQMEDDLGAPIFERSNRGVKPTVAGEALLTRARQVLNVYRDASNEFRDNAAQVRGVVEFGTASFRGQYLLPGMLKEFYRLYPEARVHITEMNSNQLERLIRDNSLDLALMALPARRRDSYVVDALFQDEVLIVANLNHPIMERVKSRPNGRLWVSFEDAAGHEFILSDPNTRLGHIARDEFGRRGLQLRSRNDNITAAFSAAMARDGLGLALTYQSCVVPGDEAVYLSMGEQGVYLELALVYPQSSYRSRATLAFGELLRASLEESLKGM